MAAAPYPPSPVIKGIKWDYSSIKQAAPGSDLWPTTWAADGNLYTAWGDGGGFGGTNVKGRVSMGFARLEGRPTNFNGININGGVNSKYPPTFNCKSCAKTAGLISVNGVIYAWINMQNKKTPDTKLAWSSDYGKTWNFADWHFPGKDDPLFFPSTFLNYGKNNQGAMDEYVYSYGARWVPTQGRENNIYLIRVHKSHIKERQYYEFFSGLNEEQQPIWNKNITNRKSVFTDSNGVPNAGLATVVYNPGIQRYIMAVAHGEKGEDSFARFSHLGIFESMKPWGPWFTVSYYNNWLSFDNTDDEALAYSLPTKWISKNGIDMWMIFSGWPKNDSFNLINLQLMLNGNKKIQ